MADEKESLDRIPDEFSAEKLFLHVLKGKKCLILDFNRLRFVFNR